MIGKPQWFKRRKYGGWGITPATWQGWVYLAAMITPLIAFQSLPYENEQLRTAATTAWIVVVAADALDIMAKLKKDERERIHEALAERNAAWFMVTALTMGILYDLIRSASTGHVYVHPFTIAALLGGLMVKSATNVWLDRKD